MTGFYWIASYPKSGNTWLRLALRELLQPGGADTAVFAPSASQRKDLEEALDVDSGDLAPAEIQALRPSAYRSMAAGATRPLYRKVHDAWRETASGPLFPTEVTLGSFYMVRDPRDVVVSWAHFAGVALDAAIAMLCDPDATLVASPGRPALTVTEHLSCWSGHVRSWLEAPGRHCCLLRFEDMLADPAALLRRAACYAGIKHDDADIDRAVGQTRFETLRQQEAVRGFDGGQAGNVPFFRCGRSGQWRTVLTAEQIARIEHSHGEMMAKLNYRLWPE